jgi:hypothetical protein
MAILTGLLFINETDVYAQYGAFLSEDKASDHTNYAALMKPSGMKPHVAVSFREENGEKLPAVLTPRSEARDVTLQFAILSGSACRFMQNYADFVRFLKSGWLDICLPELGKTFRMYLLSCSDYDQLTPLTDDGEAGDCAARFKVKFREPSPSF